jgi:hypothetical protein
MEIRVVCPKVPTYTWWKLWPIAVIIGGIAIYHPSRFIVFFGGVLCGICFATTLWRYDHQREAWRHRFIDKFILTAFFALGKPRGEEPRD